MAPEPLDPKKFHVLTKKTRLRALFVVTLTVFVLIPIGSFVFYKIAVNRPARQQDELTIKIESGESLTDISTKLYTHDAINSKFLFKAYLVINRLQNRLQAGVYTIPAGTSTAEMAKLLQHGVNDIKITFLEGWRIEEFAKAASDTFDKTDYQEFVLLAQENEGYLFPDTYIFKADISEEDLVYKLKDAFKTKTEDILTKEKLAELEITKKEVVTLASILEREIASEEDRPIVAGILIKRWSKGTLVGADATTQYAIAAGRYGCPLKTGPTPVQSPSDICPNEENVPNVDWWPDDLTIDELTMKNVYNTRAVVGLPPTPIANPGLQSIEAVINFVETDYEYYLTAPDGTTHYAETLQEHNINVAKYL